ESKKAPLPTMDFTASSAAQQAISVHRVFFPVHVYVHYTDMHNYADRMAQIRQRLTEYEFFPFPVTFTPVLASGTEFDTNIFDVYIIGGHRRYKFGIFDGRVPSLAEIVDTIGWAAVRGEN
ncbi:hypothetical protein BOX15_Mlig026284g1, partial [Macrostomum lignano]